MSRLVTFEQLIAAPELAALAIAEAASEIAILALAVAHPEIQDLHDDDSSPELLAALLVMDRCGDLRGAINRYRLALALADLRRDREPF